MQIGKEPNNIPIVIALDWGLIIHAVMRISDNFKMPSAIRVIFDAFIGLSLDLSMDIIAIRLDGGFWTWFGIPPTPQINWESVCGVSWGNYYGWFCVLLISSSILRIERIKIPEKFYKNRKVGSRFIILLIYIIATPVLSTGILICCYFIQYPIYFLTGNRVIGIIIVFGSAFIAITYYLIRFHPKINKTYSFEVVFLFISMHLYFLLAFFFAGIINNLPLFLIFLIGNLFFAVLILAKSIYFKNKDKITVL